MILVLLCGAEGVNAADQRVSATKHSKSQTVVGREHRNGDERLPNASASGPETRPRTASTTKPPLPRRKPQSTSEVERKPAFVPRPLTSPDQGGETEPRSDEPLAAAGLTWTDDEIFAARLSCMEQLAPLTADVTVPPPLREGACGAPAPVVVRSVGSSITVMLRPPVTLNCSMLVALYKWIEAVVQPAAWATLGVFWGFEMAPIVKLARLSIASARKPLNVP